MATANYTNPIPVDGVTGTFVRARILMPNGTTAGEAALIEKQTPRPEGVFLFPIPFAFTLQDGADPTAEYTIEVRQVPTQDSAGFDSSSTTNIRLAYGAFTVDAAGTISDGGQAGAAAGTTTFRLEIGDANGTLIDPAGLTSVTVKAPGIVAEGSSTAAVATGTAFTHTATGIWTGPTVTDAASGLLYLYTLVKTFSDGHTEDVPQVQQGSVSGGAVHYATLATLQNLAGIKNISDFADLEGDGSQVSARIEAALTDADSQVVAAFAARNATVPTSTSPYYGRLATLAGWYAIVYLYNPRSLNDENTRAYKAQWEANAEKELDEILWALGRDISIGGPTLVKHNPAVAGTMGASCWPAGVWW